MDLQEITATAARLNDHEIIDPILHERDRNRIVDAGINDNYRWFRAAALCTRPLCKIAEIGTRFGYSAWAMCTRPALHYIGWDIQSYENDSNAIARQILAHAYASVDITDGPYHPRPDLKDVDIVSVDGDHTYPGCSTDMDNLWALLRPGGIMIVHDTAWEPGVIQAVKNFKRPYISLPSDQGHAIFCK